MKAHVHHTPAPVAVDRYEWWTAVRASEYLGICQNAVRKMMLSGEIKAVSFGQSGKHYRTTQNWCDEYVASIMTHVASDQQTLKQSEKLGPMMLPVKSALLGKAEAILREEQHKSHKKRKPRGRRFYQR